MTVSVAREVEKRTFRPPTRSLTPLGDLANLVRDMRAEHRGGSGVLTSREREHYQTRPVEFSREVLGVDLWSKQIEILEAIRDSKRVACRSGHKCGKSTVCAVAALWFYTCFPDARVVLTAVTSRQVQGIIWREIRRIKQKSKRPIDGEIHELAHNGLKADDFREIVGFTARQSEAVSGVSGENLLYLCDEASGIDDAIFEAIDGNNASANARVAMISNPTKTSGRFFEAFHERADHWTQVHVSSAETPNAIAGRSVVPGLASREWVERMREEYGGIESPWFKIRVLGEFVQNEEGRLISLDLINEAEERWDETPSTGELQIGIDVAGPGIGGDESAFATRRGNKILGVYAVRALSADSHLAHALGLIAKYRSERDGLVTIAIDREGEVGNNAWRTFRDYLEDHPEAYRLVGVRASEKARGGDPRRGIDLVRDDLWEQLRIWLVGGGAIPTDVKLEKDLHCAEWDHQSTNPRQRVIGKDVMRKSLGGRSPDRGDAVALAVWTTPTFVPQGASPSRSGRDAGGVYEPQAEIDPYDVGGSGGTDPVYGR